MKRRPGTKTSRRARVARLSLLGVLGVAAVLAGAAWVWRGAIWRSMLDPKTPYPAYRPPPAPDYARASAWALRPADVAHAGPADPPADVFFLSTTLSDGGKDWNTPIGHARAEAFLQRVVLPNYAGPFQRVGRMFAPRYRAASLFAFLTLRDDARDARVFAYRDVRAAFDAMLAQAPSERPLVIAGVGQGASLAVRLLQDRVLHDPAVLRRVAAVYLMNSVTAVDALPASGPLSPCAARGQKACTVAWAREPEGEADRGARRLARALTWTPQGAFVNLDGRPVVCVNPLTGSVAQPQASDKANRGAVNATGLEWGVRPAFLPHQVSAACRGGLLWTSQPSAPSLQRTGGWLDQRRIAPFDLFYADIEADAEARVAAFMGRQVYGEPAPPIGAAVQVGRTSTHAID